MSKELEYNCWIVIPDVLEGLFPWLMPPVGKPLRAKKCAQKLEARTFYIVPVYDPEEKRDKRIAVRANECWEAEVTVCVRRKK